MRYIILILLVAISVILQLMTGNFPVSFMAFPLNVILLLVWLVTVFWTWRSASKSVFVRFMLSPAATFWAVFFMLGSCLTIGMTGMRWLASTWTFMLILLYFQTVLTYVILRGWREKTATGARLGAVRWRFLFLHVGLLVTVISAFWGAPDAEEARMKAYMGEPVSEAVRVDGRLVWLPYEVELKDFDMQASQDGIPVDYSASMFIDGEDVLLKVSRPYSRRPGEDIYLSGYDSSMGAESDYCVIQIVKDPWKYGKVAGISLLLTGALMLFIGGPRKRYYNDFD